MPDLKGIKNRALTRPGYRILAGAGLLGLAFLLNPDEREKTVPHSEMQVRDQRQAGNTRKK